MTPTLILTSAKWGLLTLFVFLLAVAAYRTWSDGMKKIQVLKAEFSKLYLERRRLGIELISARAELASLRQMQHRERMQSRLAIEALLNVSGPSDEVLSRVDKFLQGAPAKVDSTEGRVWADLVA